MSGENSGSAGISSRVGQMALGYVLALVLEAAGLAGLVLGLIRLRTERRARAAELRGLLLTGNAVATSSARPASANRIPRQVFVDCAPRAASQINVDARTALDRALESLRRVEGRAA